MNNTPYAYLHELAECRDVAIVGGKGANLGRLIQAGFPVPGGFVVDTRSYQCARARREQEGKQAEGALVVPPEVKAEIVAAYRALGEGPVAVRSSATAEDMEGASMAGQYETYLDIQGETELLQKIQECWASLDTPRIRAYLAEHGIEQSHVAMAVVVQRLVASEVAGVLFTINPNGNGQGLKEMVIEASWGLGESVVGGRVQPDVVRVDRETGKIIETVIADKRVQLEAGTHEERAVDEARRRVACLEEAHVRRLWELGRHAAAHFGAPQDIEWALHGGELYLLQSRPITTHLEAQAREELVTQARSGLRQNLAAGRGPWVLHNLAETLAHPTPLTWSVMERFMSGSGGFGAMYKMAGFAPAPVVCREGFLQRIGGRIYMDVARAPEMFFEDFPFAYELEELKHSPDAAQSPPTLPKGTFKARRQVGKKLGAVSVKLRKLSETFDRTLRETHVPELQAYVRSALQTNLEKLSAEELIGLWQQHEKRVMDEFAPLSLMPSLICGMALSELRAFLTEHFWEEDPDALAQFLCSNGPPNRTVLADAELFAVARGNCPLETWLAEHGHRGTGEFDLAAPRWREQPATLRDMAHRMVAGGGKALRESPLERHEHISQEVNKRVVELCARLKAPAQAEFARRMDMVRRYMPFREDGKDYLMLGYDLLRRVALEAGRRLELGDDVFYLTREELFAALRAGKVALELIESRQRLYHAEERLSLPNVIDATVVESLGETPALPATAGGHKAFAVSTGVARGRAVILHSPTDVGDLESGYILVVPSTDPSWTPLFVNAAGLVLECGGTLSHGAVVAREMGLPAVVVPDATRMFKDGEEIIVDGTRGWVGRAEAAGEREKTTGAVDIQDTHVDWQNMPPVPGPKDRFAGRARNVAAAVWMVFIGAFFLLPPAWVLEPTLAFLDIFLWPLVRVCGKPATVAIVAAVIGVSTLLLQRFLTDNARLLTAKKRAAALSSEAETLPANCPRQRTLRALAAGVQGRVLLAALVPVGLLLGPMVLPFVWFRERIDPIVWNAAPGTPVQVVAMVDAACRQPVRITLGTDLHLDKETPKAEMEVPAIRQTLERLLALYTQTQPQATKPWELDVAPDNPEAAADLRAFLTRDIPPQPLRWRVLTPEKLAGRFPLSITVGEQPPVKAELVLGDDFPPRPTTLAGSPGAALREVRLVYGKAKEEAVFWRPFAWLASVPLLDKLAPWDAGWIWLYIVAYLPVLFVARALLKVA